MEATRDIHDPTDLEAAVAALAADNAAMAEQNREMAEAERAKNERIAELEAECARWRELYLAERDARFGRRSESLPGGQLLLDVFNELEASLGPAAPDPLEQAPARRRGKGGRRPADLSGLPVEVVDHVLGSPSCPSCGSEMEDMGYDVVRELVCVPARLFVREHRVHKYVCRPCSAANRADGGATPASILRAEGPALPLPKSMASASLLAEVLHQKYAMAVPLNRLVGDLTARAGFPLTRQAVSGWVVAAHERWLALLYGALERELLSRDVVGADETTVTISRGVGRRKGSAQKSYMWVFASLDGAPVAVYRVGPTRGRGVAESFLRGWSGTLVADGYGAYDGLGPGVRRSACSSHCRRKFLEVVEARGGMEAALSDPDGRICAEAVLRFRALYLADEASADEADGGLARRERVCAMASGLAGWCLSKLPEAMPGLKAQAALRYCAEHMPKVAECCRDPRVPIDNNELERRCKAFATGRKNWQICDTLAGAQASACMYSLVETARANGLETRAWLEWVLEEMPRLGEPQAVSAEQVERFLPWSPDVPDRCRVKN